MRTGKFPSLCMWVLVILSACGPRLPKERYSAVKLEIEKKEVEDTLFVSIGNTVACPIQINIKSDSAAVVSLLGSNHHLQLEPFETRHLKMYLPEELREVEKPMRMSMIWGSPERLNIDTAFQYVFPFPKGKSYRIVQGYHGKFSHNNDFSRYAIDFDLQVGDTITAARDGVVVALINQYDVGGNSLKYRPFANYLTIYHEDGTLAQYVHLQQDGTLVELGDSVKALQPIAISGLTGFTSTPHLHFNALRPTEEGAVGFPIRFESIEGKNLRPKMSVTH